MGKILSVVVNTVYVSYQICLPGAVLLGEGEGVAAEVGLAQDALDAVHGGRLLLRTRHPRVRVREQEHLEEGRHVELL